MKLIPVLLLMITLLNSCSDKTSTGNQASDAGKLVIRYFEYFNKHDWSNMAALYADTADFKDPAYGPGIVKQTKQQLIDKYTQLAGFLPDINARVMNMYDDGEGHVTVEFVSSGSSAEGLKIELPICAIFTINNGKIVKDHTYYDNVTPPAN